MATIQDYRNEQLEKLEALKKLGVNPYPATSRRTHAVADVLNQFAELEGKQVTVSGRVMSIRTHGKLNFVDIEDGLHQIQLILKDGDVTADYSDNKLALGDINLLTRGDFVEAHGTVAASKTGQQSIMVAWYAVASKVLRPLPDELSDKEARFRRRYLDMAVNKQVRERFMRRSKFWQATRDFLNQEGFIEINIPVLEHTTGGADAKPFVTHMDALDQDYFLRISHELPLKRLLGAGFEKVYDIGPRFRNEHISDEHLPEHVAMESYAAYQNYDEAMRFYERMIQHVAHATWETLQFTNANGFEVDLSGEWPVRKYADILKEEFDVDVFEPDETQLRQILKDNNVELDGEVGVGRMLDNIWKIIRRRSAGPFWLVHEPVAISPLAKADSDDPRLALRFHPVIAGSELGNGFAELNDPQDQLQRFKDQQALRDAGDDEAQMMDIDFVEMLEHGMPPACGWGNSERNFWLLEGVTAREGVPFPHMRAEVEESSKKLYPEVFESVKKSTKSQDFSKKYVAIVDKSLEAWQVANAVGHMSAYLGNQLGKTEFDTGDHFVTSDGLELPRNSQYPILIKRAAAKDLHKLLHKLKSSHLTYHVFVKEMIDTTDDEEIVDLLSAQTSEDISIYGIAIFGKNEDVDAFTKHLQLWK